MNLLILKPFRIMVSRSVNPLGHIEYMPGMTIVGDSIPDDQSAQDWIDKGLVRDVSAAKPVTFDI